MRLIRPVLIFLAVIAIVVGFARQAGRFLVVGAPEKSDAIVVLAGETTVRPEYAVELLRQGFAPHVFLDAEMRFRIYDTQLIDIAQNYANRLPEANRVSVCPVYGLSTFGEVDDVARCLQAIAAHRVLIVTSDYHTRRALMIFRHHLPQYHFSVAGAANPQQFSINWWTSREWAKVTFDEWQKMVWWQLVDRWR